jgi:hypothetical protein
VSKIPFSAELVKKIKFFFPGSSKNFNKLFEAEIVSLDIFSMKKI